MQNVGRRMEHPAQTVAAEVAHDRHAVRFDIGLDRVADVTKRIARFCGFDPLEQRVMGDLHQAFRLAAHFARNIHAAGVAEPSVNNHRHVNVQDIAILEGLVAGNAMAHHVVHADTAGVLIAFVPDGCRHGASFFHLGPDEIIQRAGGLSDEHMRGHIIQYSRRQFASFAHASEVRCLVDADPFARHATIVVIVHKGTPIALASVLAPSARFCQWRDITAQRAQVSGLVCQAEHPRA